MNKSFSRKLKLQFIYFLAHRLPPCKLIVPLASESRERRLTWREKITFKLHLFTCKACQRYVAQIEKMSLMVKSQTEESFTEEPDTKLSSEARERIRAALKNARKS